MVRRRLGSFLTCVAHLLAHTTRRLLISSNRGFDGLKTKNFLIYFIFPPLTLFYSDALSLSSLSFPVSFFAFLLRFSFLIALDPSYSSLRNFFVGVCRVAESEGRPVCFGDLVSANCVLRRLLEELFSLAFPAINTWKLFKDRMASEGSSWPQVRSEELLSGLSDREDKGNSTNETPSVSGSSKGDESERLWIALSYLSIADKEGLKKIRDRYQIPDDVVLRISDPDKRACSSKYDDVAFYEADFNAGLRFPL